MNKISIALMVLLPVCLITGGCSFSKSSKSSSRSSSSPSRWSSPGRYKNVNKTADSFQNEAAALTILYARSGGTSQDFQQELSMISRSHGIVDWENNLHTFKSIGIGLKRGGVSKESIKTLSFLQAENIFAHYSQILSGYNLSKNAFRGGASG